MLTSQTNLDQIADRIERAYHLRHPTWTANGLTPGVWTAAAVRLLELSRAHGTIPVDPELFVAVQPYKSFRRDPWSELTQNSASKIYRLAVQKIIRQLKQELTAELRWANQFLAQDSSLDALISHPKSKASPIIKLMLCYQHNRLDLAPVVRPPAEAQHLSCPLYRPACKQLVPDEFYPHPQQRILLQPCIAAQAHSFAWN